MLTEIILILNDNIDMEDMLDLLSFAADCIVAVMALLAGIVSWIEYHSHKQKEDNKLLSQLNKRYLGSAEIQKVVKYLREIDPSDEKPSPYEVELFFRFFEELGVYMKKGSLPKKDVKTFFCHYLERMYKEERGKMLRESINNEDRKLEFLQICKKAMGI